MLDGLGPGEACTFKTSLPGSLSNVLVVGLWGAEIEPDSPTSEPSELRYTTASLQNPSPRRTVARAILDCISF
jgi:hypothetical protein